MNKITVSPDKNAQVTQIFDELGTKISISFESENEIEVSDGYHTMSELYEHRYALFAALVKLYDGYKTPLGCNVTCYKSKLHADGTMFDDSFIVLMVIKGMKVDDIKQISYHLPLSWWDKFKIMELERMWKWDGHTSNDTLKRLLEL